MERRWWLQLEWTRLSLMGRSTSSAVFHILQTEESLLCLSFTNTRALELIYNHVWYKYGNGKHEIPGSELWTEYSEMLPISQNWGSKFTPIGFQVFISVKPFSNSPNILFQNSSLWSNLLPITPNFWIQPQNMPTLLTWQYWVTLQCTGHLILLLFSWDLFGKCAFRYFELRRPVSVGESHK